MRRRTGTVARREREDCFPCLRIGRLLALGLALVGLGTGASLADEPAAPGGTERPTIVVRIPALLTEEPGDCCALPPEDYLRAVAEHLGLKVVEIRLPRAEVVLRTGSPPMGPGAVLAALKQFGLAAEILKGP